MGAGLHSIIKLHKLNLASSNSPRSHSSQLAISTCSFFRQNESERRGSKSDRRVYKLKQKRSSFVGDLENQPNMVIGVTA